MARLPTIVEALERAGERASSSTTGTSRFAGPTSCSRWSRSAGAPGDSVLPSDHCYDRINDGIPLVPSDGPIVVGRSAALA